MHNELRKLAQRIREEQTQRSETKTQKCAQVLSAWVGLELLNDKLKGDSK